MVKLRLAFLAMLASVRAGAVPAGDTISKLLALSPDKTMDNTPVACVPALVTLTDKTLLAP